MTHNSTHLLTRRRQQTSLECHPMQRLLPKWNLENYLLLNPSKTEALVTGTLQQVTKFINASAVQRVFQFAGTSVSHSNSIRVLGVTIDQHLTFDNLTAKIVQSCNYHTRGLCYIRQLVDKDMANTLLCSIVGC